MKKFHANQRVFQIAISNLQKKTSLNQPFIKPDDKNSIIMFMN